MKNKIIFIFSLIIFFCTEDSISREINFEYSADVIKYENNKKTVLAEGNAKIYDTKGRTIYSEKILYNKETGIINSFYKTKFVDSDGNKIVTNNLTFDINKNEIITVGKTEIVDKENNIFFLNNIIYQLDTKKGFGRNFSGSLKDGSRIDSKSVSFDLINKKSFFLNSNYTTCKIGFDKSNKNCPWWSLKTTNTTSDQNKKVISHKNAILKIKELPVLYLPYIQHPDPSVKRASGFLPPVFKSVFSVGKGIQLPYFFALDESQDLTVSPVLYFNENPIVITEFRKKIKNGSIILDTSYTNGYRNYDSIGKNSGSRNHFFLEYKSTFKNNYFPKNEVIAQIQKVSQVNYLKAHKINTLLVKEDKKNLENKIQLLSFNNQSSLDLSARIFEDLKKNDNDKYEYLFPYGSYSLNLIKSNNNINFNSNFLSKKIGSGQKSSEIINQIDTSSFGTIFNNLGTKHVLKTKLSNINEYVNDINYDTPSINNFFTVALDNTIPLYRKNKSSEEILSPKLFIKYTTGKMNNEKNADKNLYYGDIYSMNRSSNIKNPETGLSFGTGIDYELTKKDMFNNVYLKNSFGIGQVFRTYKLDQMATNSSLDNKQSNFAGFYNLSFFSKNNNKTNDNEVDFLKYFNQNKINVKYDFNIDKGFSRFDQNILNLSATLLNKINSEITFDEKNKYVGNERKLSFNANFLINNNFYLSTGMVKNLKDNFKETEKIGLQYENDCIKIGLNMQKSFYNNDEIFSNKKSLFLNIILKPFGNDLKPDLSSFVK